MTTRSRVVDAAEHARLLSAARPVRRLPLVAPAPPRSELLPARGQDAEVRPFYAVWEVTLRCDLACRHCGSRAGAPRRRELDTAEALGLVAQLAELGVREVSLIGGEAYLREDWLEILAAIRDHGMTPSLVTGGRGMTAARARAAAAAGLVTASVSVDGDEAVHDRLRGLAGAYRAALDALDALREAGVTVAGNTQVNRLSVPTLEGVLDALVERGARGWQIQLTVPMGRAADEPDVILQPHDLLVVQPLLAHLATQARARGLDVAAGNNVGYFGPHEETLRSGMASAHGGSCGAGIFAIGIESDGAVKGCPSLATETWSGGTVREASLRDLWQRTRALRHMRDRTKDELWGFCATCYYADVCRGGCTWMADSLLGRPGNNPYCHHRALELARAGRRERVVQVDEAPGAPFDRARFAVVEEDVPREQLTAP